jgi:hypothetical protein
MMRSGHLIYKVKNLQEAVKEWEAKGFVVEYGRKEKPNNALIYFSQGPYIELLENTGIPVIAKVIAKLFGRSKNLERFFYWDECEEGWQGLCIEKDSGDLDEEVNFLAKRGIKGLLLNNLKRIDTKNRELRYRCFFPHGTSFPFLMTYFSIDPKPKNFTHPNGIKEIKKIVFKISPAQAKILEDLVQDQTLVILEDENENGIVEVIFN